MRFFDIIAKFIFLFIYFRPLSHTFVILASTLFESAATNPPKVERCELFCVADLRGKWFSLLLPGDVNFMRIPKNARKP